MTVYDAAVHGEQNKLTAWSLTGFGGSAWQGPFSRMVGYVGATRNGSFLDLAVQFPGETTHHRLLLPRRDLGDLLTEGHGAQRWLRAETDVLHPLPEGYGP